MHGRRGVCVLGSPLYLCLSCCTCWPGLLPLPAAVVSPSGGASLATGGRCWPSSISCSTCREHDYFPPSPARDAALSCKLWLTPGTVELCLSGLWLTPHCRAGGLCLHSVQSAQSRNFNRRSKLCSAVLDSQCAV